jgi:hypothetical protein
MTVTWDSKRDRRALLLLGVAAVGIIAFRLIDRAPSVSTSASTSGTVLASPETVAAAEKRLTKLRQMAALVPGKEEALSKVRAELGSREKGILAAETPQQAQAQLIQIMRRVMKDQAPPIDITATEIGQVRPLDSNYGEALVTVVFTCRIEDLINLLTDLTKQPELIATSEMRIGGANPKEKSLPVRLTVAGVIRRDLVPDKKGTAY